MEEADLDKADVAVVWLGFGIALNTFNQSNSTLPFPEGFIHFPIIEDDFEAK